MILYEDVVGRSRWHPGADMQKNTMQDRQENINSVGTQKRAGRSWQQANHMLQAVIKSCPLPIVVLDNSANVKIWNPAAENTFGWKEEEVIDKHYPLIPDYKKEEFKENLKKMIDGVAVTKLETLRKRKDGVNIPVSLSTSVLRDQKECVIGSIIMLADITENNRPTEEQNMMWAGLMLTYNMSAIGNLASAIAHEINNPNNFILANAQFLAEVWPTLSRNLKRYITDNGDFVLGKLRYSEVDTIIPEMLNGLVEGAKRIKDIVADLKDFTWQESMQHNRNIDINKIVESALHMIQNKIIKYTDFFCCTLRDNLPQIKGSFHQLEQVVVNVIVNALQALPDRSSAIFVETFFDETEGLVIVKVRDEGTGMTEDVQRNIYNPFFTTRSHRGCTGLGLFICLAIIKIHKGIIKYETEPGRGTTFFLKFPMSSNQI